MTTKRKWDGATLKKWQEMRAQGVTLKSIGEKYGVTGGRVSQKLQAYAMVTARGIDWDERIRRREEEAKASKAATKKRQEATARARLLTCPCCGKQLRLAISDGKRQLVP